MTSLIFALILMPFDSLFTIYAILFFILILSGAGLPVPEEVTLIFGGYLAYLEMVDLWVVIYILIAGIVVADIGGYFLGRLAGNWVYKKISRFAFPTMILEKAKIYFEKYGESVVFFSRPLLGIRVAVPILAGHFRMSFTKFLLFDTLAAIPWTIFLVSLSYYLGSGLDLITDIKEIKHAVFWIIGLIVVFYTATGFGPRKLKRP